MAKARTEIVPREGEVIGWKKCMGEVIVKLRVPADAKRSNATGRKCRASHVVVMEVKGSMGEACDFGVSHHDGKTQYRVGETVSAHDWNPDRFAECAPGIHFYLTREEAQAHS